MNTMHQLGAAVFVGSCALHPGAGAQPSTPQLSPVEVVSQIAQLPLAQLEAGYLQCDRVSSSRVLDLYEATVCSATGEALLKRRFNGDFGALLAWWRAQRQSALAQQ